MADNPGRGNSPFDMDLTKLFASMTPFMPDMEALLTAHRRNIEALVESNKVALEGAQAVARRNMEIMQQSMAQLTETMQAMASPEAPQAKAAKQADMVKNAYERAGTNLKELGEMIQHANADAVGILQKRFTAAVEEVKALAKKTE